MLWAEWNIVSRSDNFYSDVKLNQQKSAEVIVPIFFREGLNNRCLRYYRYKYLCSESRNREVLSVKIRWNRRIIERMQSIEITSVESRDGVENIKVSGLHRK